MSFQTQLQNLKDLNLLTDQFVVVSSGALAVRGIREAKDLDVVVTKFLWDELIKKYPVIKQGEVERIQFGNDIEILNPSQSVYGGGEDISIEDIFGKADLFDGIKFLNLEQLRTIKGRVGREKDLQDLVLIDTYLESQKQ